jgi:hypothetical protein
LIVNGNILLEQRTKVIFQYLLIGALLGGSGIIVAPEIAAIWNNAVIPMTDLRF